MNENLIFVGLGQYAKSIQVFFAAIGIFKESLIGGWFDAETQVFIQEKCAVLRLNKFNRFLVKLFLKREKEFLLTSGFTFAEGNIQDFKDGFTKFENNNTFIIPNSLNFIKYNEL